MILVVQHETDCPPGLVARPELRADMRIVHPYRGDAVPTSLKPGDALIVLGGEMGAMDDAQYPWLTQTKELIAEAVSAEIPTLLICLGHQLGAVALGGAIGQYEAGPIWGVTPVGLTDAGRDDPLLRRLPQGASAVHWNGDIVTELPQDAVVLARDPRAAVQAVRYGPLAWGFQCHPEVDVEIVARWAAGQDEVADPGSTARAERALDETTQSIDVVQAAWLPVLDAFAAVAMERAG